MTSMKIGMIVILVSMHLIGYAQSRKYLVLKHREKQKEVVISEGEFVVVKTFKGEKVRGQMQILADNMIRVKHKVVPLTSVERIGRRSPGISRVASLVVTTGMNLFLYGLTDNLKNGWEQPSENYKASTPLLAVGIPLLVFTYKRTSKHWKYEGAVGNW